MKSSNLNLRGLLPIGRVAIRSLALGTLLIVLLECYYVITTPGTTTHAAITDVLLSIAVILIVALFFITELKGAKTEAEAGAKELAASEEKYRRLLGDINDGYCVIQDEKVVFANEKYAQITEIPFDQIIGSSMGSYLPPDVQQQVQERHRRRILGEAEPERFELTTATGRAVEVNVKRIEYEDRPAVSVVLRDFTERKQIEESLQESEEKLRLMFESVAEGIVVTDLNGVIIDANDRAAEIRGVDSKAELLGRNPIEFTAPHERDRAMLNLRKTLEGGVTTGSEYACLKADGSEFPGEVSSSVLKDTDGNPSGLVAVVRDITRRKRIEEALRESEEKYRHLFENLNDAAFLADMDTGAILETNLQGEALLGRSRDEIVGMHQSELHPPGKADEYRQRFAAHVEKGHSADYDGEIIRKDGTVVPVAITASPLTVGGQHIILGLFHDITERKRAEQALRRSEEQFRRLLGDINDAYFIIQDEKYVIANQRAADVAGTPIDQIVGTSITGVSLERYRKRIKGELPPAERYELTTAAGRTYDYSVKLVDYEGRPAVSAVVRDITERKQMEEQLRESERLYSTMAHASQIGVYIVQDGKFVLVNRQFQKDIGYAEDELLGKDPLSLVHPEDRETVREKAVKMLKGERSSAYEYRGTNKAGETKWTMETVASIQYQGKRATLGNFMDITDRKRMEEIIRHMAYHDPLTGLPNRMLFDDRLKVALAQAQRNQQELAVMFLDLDGFKGVNDTLGHKMGDLLLQAVGERLTRLMRKSDSIARMGGDEFALILPEVARVEDADTVAQKILEALREPFGLDGAEVCTTASIGIAVYPDHEKDADTLVSNADTAMYCAKEQGGNRYLRYTPAMRTKTPDGLSVVT